ncbi:MAG: glutamate--tRNA ligase [Candidatus Berkelbacteria bacterium]|nr:glutamate--tRNA ligase [Candidatus Berkelbacteria bacterium]
MIRVRFAPSPTGKLHIGNARAFLFNFLFAKQSRFSSDDERFLFAKKNKGKIVLRIEDTDRDRSTLENEKDIIENLKWLGLSWDEGPFRQMDRLKIYQKYAGKLFKEKKAYYCYCTPGELAKEKEEQLLKKMPPKYSGRCRDLTFDQIKKYEKEDRRKAIRFKVTSKIVEFEDLIHGKVRFDTGLEGDFVLIKSDGVPTFHFGVVVDDAEMKISHVIRGEDHLSNTPKQILLQKALGFLTPKYAHIPLILNPDRSKMSKRYGAVDISSYREMGYLTESLINYFALLGWTPGGTEILNMKDLIKDFSIENIQKSPAAFYKEKLDWVCGEWIRKLTPKELQERVVDFGYQKLDLKIIEIIQPRMKRLDEVPFWTSFFFQEVTYDKKLLVKDLDKNGVKAIFEIILSQLAKITWKTESLKQKSRDLADRLDLKFRDFVYPLRISITGNPISTPLFESMEILGREECFKRFKNALRKL